MDNERCFGKRFCTYCGKNTMYYYSWKTNNKLHLIGECSCGNIDYCDGETTEEEVAQRLKKRNFIFFEKTLDK